MNLSHAKAMEIMPGHYVKSTHQQTIHAVEGSFGCLLHGHTTLFRLMDVMGPLRDESGQP